MWSDQHWTCTKQASWKMGNSIRCHVTNERHLYSGVTSDLVQMTNPDGKPPQRDGYKLPTNMGASSSSGMNLDWLAMDTPYWDTSMIWVVIIWRKEAHSCSLSLWTWKVEDVSVSLLYFPFPTIGQRVKSVRTHQYLSRESASQPLNPCSRLPTWRLSMLILYLPIYTFHFVLFNVFPQTIVWPPKRSFFFFRQTMLISSSRLPCVLFFSSACPVIS